MESLFLSKPMCKSVDAVHDSFDVLPAIDLLDFSIAPHKNSLTVFKNPSSHQAIRALLVQHLNIKQSIPVNTLNSFGVYDLVACNYINSRFEMLLTLPSTTLAIMTKPLEKVTVYNLEEVSRYATGAMQAYWIKHAAIQLGFIKTYKGIQPYTSPVDRATNLLFDDSLSQYRHTVYCIETAAKIGTYPSHINTALWILGERASR